MVERVSELMRTASKRKSEDEAIATVATMVGGLVSSRAVNDTELADRILASTRKSLMALSQGKN